MNKNREIGGLENTPDGMIEISSSNPRKFDYRLQINDYSYFQYHRNNGITKLGLVQPGIQKTEFGEDMADTGNTTYVMRPVEGAMQLQDKMNQAYLREIFPGTHVISG